MLTAIHPKLPMRNKAATRDFYINKLGFHAIGSTDFDGYLMVEKDNIELHFFEFKDCKMLGLRFDSCNPFGLSFSFDGCQLNHSSFYKTKIKKTVFSNSQLQETDFAEADLTGAVFDNCDLMNAVFDRTLLEKADLRTSYNYTIDPETNRLKKAKFSVSSIAGLLAKYDINIS